MKVRIEIEDTEVLQYVTMLHAISEEFKEFNEQNLLLMGSVYALKDKLFNSLIDQVPIERGKEITKML